jgi:hypothetical protein
MSVKRFSFTILANLFIPNIAKAASKEKLRKKVKRGLLETKPRQR